MITNISLFTLWVTDQDEAKRFYLDEATAATIRRALDNGTMGGFGLNVDDCRQTYAELSAAGVEFVQEPLERPYGVEAVMRDSSGNWLVLVESRPYAGEDFAHG